jgi:FixJ family two-component response regulator
VSGFEVQDWLGKSNMDLPVVIITGHDSVETRERAMKGKPVAFLRKPVNDQVLRDAIDLALGHYTKITDKDDGNSESRQNTYDQEIKTQRR